MKKVILFWFFLFGITQFSFAQDSLVAKILYDFNNRPICLSNENEIAQKLMLNPGITEKVLLDTKVEITGFIPWSAYRTDTYQEVWYQNGWHIWTLLPNVKKDKAGSVMVKITVIVILLAFLLFSQIEGMVTYAAVKNNRVYGNPVDEFTKLSEKKMLFDKNKFLFLIKEGSFWLGMLVSMFIHSLLINKPSYPFQILSFFVVCFGGLMNAWWYKRSIEKLAFEIFGPIPPSDDD